MSENIKKRKRTKNTTNSQYELYLEAVEKDYTFRSNTLNPTLPPNYIQNKWEELTLQLNALGGDGPALTAEEWKKRFADWKYATKAKARKIASHRNKTGGGPCTDLKLNDLEERAVNVWGRVTVEGAKCTIYEGIPVSPIPVVQDLGKNLPYLPLDNVDENEIIVINVEKDNGMENDPSHSNGNISLKGSSRSRPKPLSVIAENLLQITEQNATNSNEFIETIKQFGKNYIKLERDKLEFAIKRFKYLHPDFSL